VTPALAHILLTVSPQPGPEGYFGDSFGYEKNRRPRRICLEERRQQGWLLGYATGFNLDFLGQMFGIARLQASGEQLGSGQHSRSTSRSGLSERSTTARASLDRSL
jgi:hypothetical protein